MIASLATTVAKADVNADLAKADLGKGDVDKTAVSKSGGGPALTLDEAIRRGEQQSPLVRRARAASRVVAAREVGASIVLPSNPVAAVLVGPRRESTGGSRRDGLQYVAHLEQAVEIAGQRGARLEVVARARDVAGLQEKIATIETRARVRAAYMGAVMALVRAEASREQEALVARVHEAVSARVKSGAASDIDLRLSEAETGRLARQRVAAELAARETLAVLAALTGLPAGSSPTLVTRPAEPAVRLPPLGELVRRADAHRAELRALEASGVELDAELALLAREAVPSPTLVVEIERDLPGQTFVGAGMALPLPLWRRHQGERAVVRAEQRRLAEERSVASREVALEVELAYHTVISTHEQALMLEKRVVPAANATVALLTEGWRAGKFDLFRVLQASRDAADARRAEIDVLAEFWRAVVDLDRAVGAM